MFRRTILANQISSGIFEDNLLEFLECGDHQLSEAAKFSESRNLTRVPPKRDSFHQALSMRGWPWCSCRSGARLWFQIQAKFEADFQQALPIDAEALEQKPIWRRAGTQFSRLAAPARQGQGKFLLLAGAQIDLMMPSPAFEQLLEDERSQRFGIQSFDSWIVEQRKQPGTASRKSRFESHQCTIGFAKLHPGKSGHCLRADQ